MRLEKIQDILNVKNKKFQYNEIDGCGSIDFEHRGLAYHIWEYNENGWGADSNIRTGGTMQDITDDYESEIVDIIKKW